MGLKGSKVKDEGEAPTPIMVEDRKCRDICCLPIFIGYWVGMVAIAVMATTSEYAGDPARLLYGVDYVGENCGAKSRSCVGDEPCGKYLAYPQMDKDLYRAQQQGVLNDPLKLKDFPFYGVCRQRCPEGSQDVNGDGELDNWVCSYEMMERINTAYGANEVSNEIPSADARIALEECLADKSSSPFLSVMGLSESKLLSNGQTANCKLLMEGCSKMYAEERGLLFRCIPKTEDNSTCTRSPYLEHINKSVSIIEYSDGRTAVRRGSNPYCGVCLDPVEDTDGSPMNPASDLCRAKKVFSTSESTQATVNPVFAQVNTWTATLQAWMGDIMNCGWQVCVSGAVIPFFSGILFLMFLRMFAGTFIFVVLWGLLVCFGFLACQFLVYGGVLSVSSITNALAVIGNATGIDVNTDSVSETLEESDVFDNEMNEKKQMYEILGWVFTAITIIYFIMLIGLRQRVKITVAIMKEATKCVAAMPTIFLFPGFTVVGTVGLGIYWLFIALYISSMGEIKELSIDLLDNPFESSNNTGRILTEVSMDDLGDAGAALGGAVQAQLENVSYVQMFWLAHFMGYLWTNQFIQAIGCTTIAGAVGSWYWASPGESDDKSSNLPKRPISKSAYRVFRYHLGSLAFGSFIIAVVQLIRFVLMYLDKQTQGLQKKNKMVMILMKAIQCCLWILEKILKFITKNAYIMIALFGKSFCASTTDAFVLILTNLARVGTATSVSNLVLLIGRLLIVTLGCFICINIISITAVDEDAPSSVAPPVFACGVLAWFVSGCFLNVYGLTIDTLLISFCVDESRNDGSASKPYYMTKSLRKITKKKNKAPVDEDDESDSEDVAEKEVQPAKKEKTTLL